MKIHVLSDLHLEFNSYEYAFPEADVCVLAGDIGTGLKGVEFANSLPYGNVIYVLGNHEFYGHDIDDMTYDIKVAADDNVHVLDDEYVDIDGVRFLGCTLWTDFALHGNQLLSMQVAESQMNDFHRIKTSTRKLQPKDTIIRHLESRAFLWRHRVNYPRVVVTHHLPSRQSIAPIYRGNALNPAFASELDDLIDWFGGTWIHGHTHESCDYVLRDKRIVCNPRGYKIDRTGFDPNLVIEVDNV